MGVGVKVSECHRLACIAGGGRGRANHFGAMSRPARRAHNRAHGAQLSMVGAASEAADKRPQGWRSCGSSARTAMSGASPQLILGWGGHLWRPPCSLPLGSHAQLTVVAALLALQFVVVGVALVQFAPGDGTLRCNCYACVFYAPHRPHRHRCRKAKMQEGVDELRSGAQSTTRAHASPTMPSSTEQAPRTRIC